MQAALAGGTLVLFMVLLSAAAPSSFVAGVDDGYGRRGTQAGSSLRPQRLAYCDSVTVTGDTARRKETRQGFRVCD